MTRIRSIPLSGGRPVVKSMSTMMTFCSLCLLLGLVLDGNHVSTAFSTPYSCSRAVNPHQRAATSATSILRAKPSKEPSASGADATTKSLEQEQLQIAFVTGNKMKARELDMILAEATQGNDKNNLNGSSKSIAKDGDDYAPSSLVNLRVINVDLPEIQEVNTEAIAKEKALLGAQLAGGPCVVEDTSLQFTALGGMPGPYIKWFQERLGSKGLYNILTAYEDKSAQAVCTLAFCPYPHADPVLFTGVTHGQIVEPVEGRGFGWDAIFVPDGKNGSASDGVPFSCMTTAEKNAKSHRGKAVRQWAAWLQLNQQELRERQSGRPAIGHKGLDFSADSVEE